MARYSLLSPLYLMAMYGTDDKTSCGQKVSFNLQPRWYRQYSRPGIFTNEIFWRWAGRPPGYRTGQKEKQTPPTSLRKGGPPCRRGWGGAPRRGGHTRNEEVDIEKWFVWVTWLATCRDGYRRRKLSAQNFRQKLIDFWL